MKKTKYLVAALLLMGATATFTSCIDTEEPAGITELRGAKAELIKAKAAVELANEAYVRAQVTAKELANKAEEIAIKRAEWQLAIDQANQAIQDEETKAQHELYMAQKKAALEQQIEEAKAAMLRLQAQTADAQKAYDEALHAIELAKLTMSQQDQQMIMRYENYVTNAQNNLQWASQELFQATAVYNDYMMGYAQGMYTLPSKAELESEVEKKQAEVNVQAAYVKDMEDRVDLLKADTTEWQALYEEYHALYLKSQTALEKYQLSLKELDASPIGLARAEKKTAKAETLKVYNETSGKYNQALQGDPTEKYAYKNEDFVFGYEKESNMARLVGDWNLPLQNYRLEDGKLGIGGSDESYYTFQCYENDPVTGLMKINPEAPTNNQNSFTFYNQLKKFLKDVETLAPYTQAAENKAWYDSEVALATENETKQKKNYDDKVTAWEKALSDYDKRDKENATEEAKLLTALQTASDEAFGTYFLKPGETYRLTKLSETEIKDFKAKPYPAYHQAGAAGTYFAAQNLLAQKTLLQSEATEIEALKKAIETEIAATEERYKPTTENLLALEKETNEAFKADVDAQKAVTEAEKAYNDAKFKLEQDNAKQIAENKAYEQIDTYLSSKVNWIDIEAAEQAVANAKANFVRANKELEKAQKRLALFEEGKLTEQAYAEFLKEEVTLRQTKYDKAQADLNKAMEELKKVTEALAQ